MSGLLLDTNVLSEPTRPKPDPQVTRWFEAADERTFHLSVLTLGEIRNGIATLTASKTSARLESWLQTELKERLQERILPVTGAIAERWGILQAHARRGGRVLPTIDGLLAATAFEHGLTLVTPNVRDFERLGVDVINPWEAR